MVMVCCVADVCLHWRSSACVCVVPGINNVTYAFCLSQNFEPCALLIDFPFDVLSYCCVTYLVVVVVLVLSLFLSSISR